MRCWHFTDRFLCKILQHKKNYLKKGVTPKAEPNDWDKMSKKKENAVTHTKRWKNHWLYKPSHKLTRGFKQKTIQSFRNMTAKQGASEFEWKSSQNALGKGSFPWSIYLIGCELCLCICSPHTYAYGKSEFLNTRHQRHLSPVLSRARDAQIWYNARLEFLNTRHQRHLSPVLSRAGDAQIWYNAWLFAYSKWCFGTWCLTGSS